MKTDGVFTLHEVKLPKWKVGQTLTLVPFGDIHRDSPACSLTHWKEFLTRARKLKDVLFLGMGDYTDSYSTSERDVMMSNVLHDSTRTRQEESGRSRIRILAKELAFMRGRLVGLLGGNHFMSFRDGTTGDQYLANLLGCRYLGVCSAIRIALQTVQAGYALDIFAHHGRGAGQTAGGRYNSVEKLANIAEADIYLMGDNHARGALPVGDRLRIVSCGKSGVVIRARTPWLGRTGSFLLHYEDGQASYVVDRALAPSSLGWIEFYITPRRLRHGPTQETHTLEIKSMQ